MTQAPGNSNAVFTLVGSLFKVIKTICFALLFFSKVGLQPPLPCRYDSLLLLRCFSVSSLQRWPCLANTLGKPTLLRTLAWLRGP